MVPSIIATGATSPNATARGAGDPAASATAWAATACWWVRRNPAVPLAASPKAKWMSPSASAVLAAAASNVSRIPSGSQAHALDSSRGRNTGSPAQAACAATWLIACSSRVISSTGARRVARPAHQAHVVLAQPVAQRGLRRAHVDPLARQQVADPGGPGGAAVPQPVLPLLGVGRDHLLGGLVDVPGHDPGHAQRGGADHLGVVRLPSQFREQPVGEARVPDPVGAQQRGQRRAALGQPARVLHGRGRGLHGGQVDPVLHDLQAGVDVAVDARSEQGKHRLVVA